MKVANYQKDYTGIGYLTFSLADSTDTIEIYADYDEANNRSVHYIAWELYQNNADYGKDGANYKYVKEFLGLEE